MQNVELEDLALVVKDNLAPSIKNPTHQETFELLQRDPLFPNDLFIGVIEEGLPSPDLSIATISPKLRSKRHRLVKGKVPQYLSEFEIDHPDNGMILQQSTAVGVGDNAHQEVPHQLVLDDLPGHTRHTPPHALTPPNNDHGGESPHGQVRDTRITTPSPVNVSSVTRFSRPGHVHGQAPSVVNTVSTVFIGTRAHPGFILGQSVGDAQDESGEDFAFNANHPISRMIRRHRAKGDMTEVENLVRACKCTYISARNVQSLTDDPDSREEVIAKQMLGTQVMLR